MPSVIHYCLAVVLLIVPVLRAESGGDTPPVIQPNFTISTLVGGLQDPDGMAFHPVSGELYVSEESAGRISVIRHGKAVPVIQSGFSVRLDDAGESPTPQPGPSDQLLLPTLRNPEGLTFGPDQHLYVAEDTPGGRILRFEADASAHYRKASVVAIPNLGEPYAWESICFARDGRMFIAGSSYEGTRTWGYSCVMARDPAQQWWMVDYGPLASFSAVAMAEDEQVLVVGDESVGGLTWWDAEAQRELQTQTHKLGSIEGVCHLPDGALAVALESSDSGGRVVRVDPSTGAITILAEGLGTLESVIYDRLHGRILVAEDSTGRILALTPESPIRPGRALLQVARRGSEAQRGLPPRQAPEFLRSFMRKVGVELVDQSAQEGSGTSGGGAPAMTLEELGQRIPLVAGRVSVEPMEGVADPVTEISFLSLFPNQVSKAGGQIIPSLCLYSAKRQSGRVERSELLNGILGGKFNAETGWDKLPAQSLLMVPLTTCSTVQTSNGVTVVLTFLGLDRFEDGFLTIHYGRSNEAFFATSSDKLRVAKATFVNRQADGREAMDFAMTGVRPRRVEEATWLRLGTQVNWTLLSPGLDTWVSRRTLALMPELVAKMRRYNHYIVDTLLVDAPAAERQPGGLAVPSQKEPSPAEPLIQHQADRAPSETLNPLADLKIAPPHDEENESLTNMILNQIVQVWTKGWSH